MFQRIAVLSCNYNDTWNWLIQTHIGRDKVKQANQRTASIIDINDNEYYIITDASQARGMEFQSYIKSPNFYTLEDTIKERIR